jgi:hypothetical protein
MKRPRHPNRITELRQAREMSRGELAREVEPPAGNESVIYKLENGMIPLNQDWMYRLAKALGCRAWDFLPESVEMPIAEQIKALWQQLNEKARTKLLHQLGLLKGKAGPAFEAEASDIPEEAGGARDADLKLVEVDMSLRLIHPLALQEEGSYAVTVYYRPTRKPRE